MLPHSLLDQGGRDESIFTSIFAQTLQVFFPEGMDLKIVFKGILKVRINKVVKVDETSNVAHSEMPATVVSMNLY